MKSAISQQRTQKRAPQNQILRSVSSCEIHLAESSFIDVKVSEKLGVRKTAEKQNKSQDICLTFSNHFRDFYCSSSSLASLTNDKDLTHNHRIS